MIPLISGCDFCILCLFYPFFVKAPKVSGLKFKACCGWRNLNIISPADIVLTYADNAHRGCLGSREKRLEP